MRKMQKGISLITKRCKMAKIDNISEDATLVNLLKLVTKYQKRIYFITKIYTIDKIVEINEENAFNAH